ncbi:hypothetical protein B0H16DRAFT_1893443 [Mycena metata]|uniref:Uncharacterized protein n=1 Tax=Mycena metata TaxID=1033252 RepID=A0AAD7MT88_9AGAR|nr:hypothetical protein B0H16DRAFT_1893443 [Mycena metata]
MRVFIAKPSRRTRAFEFGPLLVHDYYSKNPFTAARTLVAAANQSSASTKSCVFLPRVLDNLNITHPTLIATGSILLSTALLPRQAPSANSKRFVTLSPRVVRKLIHQPSLWNTTQYNSSPDTHDSRLFLTPIHAVSPPLALANGYPHCGPDTARLSPSSVFALGLKSHPGLTSRYGQHCFIDGADAIPCQLSPLCYPAPCTPALIRTSLEVFWRRGMRKNSVHAVMMVLLAKLHLTNSLSLLPVLKTPTLHRLCMNVLISFPWPSRLTLDSQCATGLGLYRRHHSPQSICACLAVMPSSPDTVTVAPRLCQRSHLL